MTQVKGVDQQVLKQGYRGAQANKAASKHFPQAKPQDSKAHSPQGPGPAAILELSPEARELIKTKPS